MSGDELNRARRASVLSERIRRAAGLEQVQQLEVETAAVEEAVWEQAALTGLLEERVARMEFVVGRTIAARLRSARSA